MADDDLTPPSESFKKEFIRLELDEEATDTQKRSNGLLYISAITEGKVRGHHWSYLEKNNWLALQELKVDALTGEINATLDNNDTNENYHDTLKTLSRLLPALGAYEDEIAQFKLQQGESFVIPWPKFNESCKRITEYINGLTLETSPQAGMADTISISEFLDDLVEQFLWLQDNEEFDDRNNAIDAVVEQYDSIFEKIWGKIKIAKGEDLKSIFKFALRVSKFTNDNDMGRNNCVRISTAILMNVLRADIQSIKGDKEGLAFAGAFFAEHIRPAIGRIDLPLGEGIDLLARWKIYASYAFILPDSELRSIAYSIRQNQQLLDSTKDRDFLELSPLFVEFKLLLSDPTIKFTLSNIDERFLKFSPPATPDEITSAFVEYYMDAFKRSDDRLFLLGTHEELINSYNQEAQKFLPLKDNEMVRQLIDFSIESFNEWGRFVKTKSLPKETKEALRKLQTTYSQLPESDALKKARSQLNLHLDTKPVRQTSSRSAASSSPVVPIPPPISSTPIVPTSAILPHPSTRQSSPKPALPLTKDESTKIAQDYLEKVHPALSSITTPSEKIRLLSRERGLFDSGASDDNELLQRARTLFATACENACNDLPVEALNQATLDSLFIIADMLNVDAYQRQLTSILVQTRKAPAALKQQALSEEFMSAAAIHYANHLYPEMGGLSTLDQVKEISSFLDLLGGANKRNRDVNKAITLMGSAIKDRKLSIEEIKGEDLVHIFGLVKYLAPLQHHSNCYEAVDRLLTYTESPALLDDIESVSTLAAAVEYIQHHIVDRIFLPRYSAPEYVKWLGEVKAGVKRLPSNEDTYQEIGKCLAKKFNLLPADELSSVAIKDIVGLLNDFQHLQSATPLMEARALVSKAIANGHMDFSSATLDDLDILNKLHADLIKGKQSLRRSGLKSERAIFEGAIKTLNSRIAILKSREKKVAVEESGEQKEAASDMERENPASSSGPSFNVSASSFYMTRILQATKRSDGSKYQALIQEAADKKWIDQPTREEFFKWIIQQPRWKKFIENSEDYKEDDINQLQSRLAKHTEKTQDHETSGIKLIQRYTQMWQDPLQHGKANMGWNKTIGKAPLKASEVAHLRTLRDLAIQVHLEISGDLDTFEKIEKAIISKAEWNKRLALTQKQLTAIIDQQQTTTQQSIVATPVGEPPSAETDLLLSQQIDEVIEAIENNDSEKFYQVVTRILKGKSFNEAYTFAIDITEKLIEKGQVKNFKSFEALVKKTIPNVKEFDTTQTYETLLASLAKDPEFNSEEECQGILDRIQEARNTNSHIKFPDGVTQVTRIWANAIKEHSSTIELSQELSPTKKFATIRQIAYQIITDKMIQQELFPSALHYLHEIYRHANSIANTQSDFVTAWREQKELKDESPSRQRGQYMSPAERAKRIANELAKLLNKSDVEGFKKLYAESYDKVSDELLADVIQTSAWEAFVRSLPKLLTEQQRPRIQEGVALTEKNMRVLTNLNKYKNRSDKQDRKKKQAISDFLKGTKVSMAEAGKGNLASDVEYAVHTLSDGGQTLSDLNMAKPISDICEKWDAIVREMQKRQITYAMIYVRDGLQQSSSTVAIEDARMAVKMLEEANKRGREGLSELLNDPIWLSLVERSGEVTKEEQAIIALGNTLFPEVKVALDIQVKYVHFIRELLSDFRTQELSTKNGPEFMGEVEKAVKKKLRTTDVQIREDHRACIENMLQFCLTSSMTREGVESLFANSTFEQAHERISYLFKADKMSQASARYALEIMPFIKSETTVEKLIAIKGSDAITDETEKASKKEVTTEELHHIVVVRDVLSDKNFWNDIRNKLIQNPQWKQVLDTEYNTTLKKLELGTQLTSDQKKASIEALKDFFDKTNKLTKLKKGDGYWRDLERTMDKESYIYSTAVKESFAAVKQCPKRISENTIEEHINTYKSQLKEAHKTRMTPPVTVKQTVEYLNQIKETLKSLTESASQEAPSASASVMPIAGSSKSTSNSKLHPEHQSIIDDASQNGIHYKLIDPIGGTKINLIPRNIIWKKGADKDESLRKPENIESILVRRKDAGEGVSLDVFPIHPDQLDYKIKESIIKFLRVHAAKLDAHDLPHIAAAIGPLPGLSSHGGGRSAKRDRSPSR